MIKENVNFMLIFMLPFPFMDLDTSLRFDTTIRKIEWVDFSFLCATMFFGSKSYNTGKAVFFV